MIAENIATIKENIRKAAINAGRDPKNIKLVAVSKRFPTEIVQKAIKAGQDLFGENYIQEVQEKKPALGDAAHIHFIGNLQSNKARFAAQYCAMVETVDRVKIAKALNKHAGDFGKTLDILIQVNIGEDSNKSGTTKTEAIDLITQVKQMEHLRICGLMTIPPFNDDAEETRKHFANLRLFSEELVHNKVLSCPDGIELSMGMSGDYQVAIEEGATIVRVGSAIFGQRPY